MAAADTPMVEGAWELPTNCYTRKQRVLSPNSIGGAQRAQGIAQSVEREDREYLGSVAAGKRNSIPGTVCSRHDTPVAQGM
jgi:hypothetical protein